MQKVDFGSPMLLFFEIASIVLLSVLLFGLAGWAFLKLMFRSKRDWAKTTKTGVAAPRDFSKQDFFS